MRFELRRSVVAGVTLLAAASLPAAAQQAAQSTPLEKAVRKQLRSLPNYGVFDLLTFKVTPGGVATVGGYVIMPQLKTDAVKAMKEVMGVTNVEDKIEVAPVNIQDDELRRKIYNAIYHDPLLSRYGTAADEAAASRAIFAPWGDRYHDFGEFRGARWGAAPYFGNEPVGNYAIHILVKNGVVTLAGVVDSEADKSTAGINTKKVFGVLTLNNDLHVRPPK